MPFMSKINRFFLTLAGVMLGATMVMAVANMILRPLDHPVTGSFELMGLGSAVVTALGLGYSYEKKAHIAVDILFDRFPRCLRKILAFLGQVACGLFFSAVAWKMLLLAINFRKSGELSETLRLPFYPVTVTVAVGIGVLSLNLFVSALRAFGSREKGRADK